MIFSRKILKKIIKENKSTRQIYNIPGDARYDYYKDNDVWHAMDKERNNLELNLSKYPEAVESLNKYFKNNDLKQEEKLTRKNPSYLEGDTKYRYFIENGHWYAFNATNNKEIDLSKNKDAVDILNQEFNTNIEIEDTLNPKPVNINPNAVKKYIYPKSNDVLIEDEKLMEIMLDFAISKDLTWGAFIKLRSNPGVKKEYVGITEKSGGYPIYSKELHEFGTRLNAIADQFSKEVKDVFKNEGYKVGDLANRGKRKQIYDKIKLQYEEGSPRLQPPLRFIDLFDTRGYLKYEYRPKNLRDLPEKLTEYAAQKGRSDVEVKSNGVVRSIDKVVNNTNSNRSNVSLHLFGLKHDLKITTNPPIDIGDDMESLENLFGDAISDASIYEQSIINEKSLRIFIKELLVEQSALSSVNFQKMSFQFSKKEKAMPERGINEEFFKFIFTDDDNKQGLVFGLTVSGDVYMRSRGGANKFKKLDLATKDTDEKYGRHISNIEMVGVVKRFIDNISVDNSQAPGINDAINNAKKKVDNYKKQINDQKSNARLQHVKAAWPLLKDFVYQYSSTAKLYIQGTMKDDLVKQHKALAKDLETHLQANGFPDTEIEAGSGGRDLEAAAATDNPARISGSLHGFNFAIDFKIHCPEADVPDYRADNGMGKGTKNNKLLVKNSELVKQIDAFVKKQSEYRWGANFGKGSTAAGKVTGRGIKEFHHFEIAPGKLTGYLNKQVKDVLKFYGFKDTDIKIANKRAELYKKIGMDYFEGLYGLYDGVVPKEPSKKKKALTKGNPKVKAGKI